jgi:hypothetical protein
MASIDDGEGGGGAGAGGEKLPSDILIPHPEYGAPMRVKLALDASTAADGEAGSSTPLKAVSISEETPSLPPSLPSLPFPSLANAVKAQPRGRRLTLR